LADSAPTVARRAEPVTGPPLVPPGSLQGGASAFVELVLHLARRELKARHQFTLLGWAWPLTRQLAQLAVLVFVFSKVLDLGIEDFPVFVFTGLLAWTWFASGMGEAVNSLLSYRHLALQPRLPSAVLPAVAVAVPLVDVLIALPVLAVMLVGSGELHWSALAAPLLIVVQLWLMMGLAWIASATAVFFRDVPNVVYLGLTLLFYLTPVFYGPRSIPPDYAWVLNVNPLTTIIEAYRGLLLGDPMPPPWRLAAVAAVSLLTAVAGLLVFRRLESRFPDYL
jgi:lipopolysaccharide transport system permease protein